MIEDVLQSISEQLQQVEEEYNNKKNELVIKGKRLSILRKLRDVISIDGMNFDDGAAICFKEWRGKCGDTIPIEDTVNDSKFLLEITMMFLDKEYFGDGYF